VDVGFDGAYRQEQPFGDFAVGQAIGHQPQYLQFALAQGFDELEVGGWR